ncbi:MAG: hypothetical protein QM737_22615 [Ferruginibacter sp.]
MEAYVNQNASPIATKAITGPKTMKLLLSNKGVQFGKAPVTVNTMSNSVTFSDGSNCDVVLDTDTATSTRKLVFTPLKVNKKYCFKDLYATVLSTAISKGQSKETMDSVTWSTVADDIAANVSWELEKLMWKGDTTLTGNLSWFDGYAKLITGAGTTLTLTGSDLIAKLQSAVSQVPITLRSQDDFRIFMGEDTKAALDLALYNKNLFNPGSMDFIPGTTVKIEVVSGLNGTNKIFPIRISNLRAIIDDAGDEAKAEMIYDGITNNSYINFHLGAGVQIVFPTEAYYASVA